MKTNETHMSWDSNKYKTPLLSMVCRPWRSYLLGLAAILSLGFVQEAQAECTSWNKPSKSVQYDIQQNLKALGLYSGMVDGEWGPLSQGAIQKAVAKWAGYKGRTDGSLAGNGVGTCRAVQKYATACGGYSGPIDGIPGSNTWNGFLAALKRQRTSPYTLTGPIGDYLVARMTWIGCPSGSPTIWADGEYQSTSKNFTVLRATRSGMNTGTNHTHGALRSYLLGYVKYTGFPTGNEYSTKNAQGQTVWRQTFWYQGVEWNEVTGKYSTWKIRENSNRSMSLLADSLEEDIDSLEEDMDSLEQDVDLPQEPEPTESTADMPETDTPVTAALSEDNDGLSTGCNAVGGPFSLAALISLVALVVGRRKSHLPVSSRHRPWRSCLLGLAAIFSLGFVQEAQAQCTWKEPTQALQKDIQQALKNLGLYSGWVDGEWGPLSRQAIQKAVRNWAGYTGPTDGYPGANTCEAVRKFAYACGSYYGSLSGSLNNEAWIGFLSALKRPKKYSLYMSGAIGPYIAANMYSLGCPLNAEYYWAGGYRQETQRKHDGKHLAVVWKGNTGVYTLYPPVKDFISRNNNIAWIGFPTAEKFAINTLPWCQTFEKCRLCWPHLSYNEKDISAQCWKSAPTPTTSLAMSSELDLAEQDMDLLEPEEPVLISQDVELLEQGVAPPEQGMGAPNSDVPSIDNAELSEDNDGLSTGCNAVGGPFSLAALISLAALAVARRRL